MRQPSYLSRQFASHDQIWSSSCEQFHLISDCRRNSVQRWADLRALSDATRIAAEPVFRPISGCGTVAGTALGVGCENTILKDSATPAQLDYVPDLQSHILRRGMATSAHPASTDFRNIQNQGGWRHGGTMQG